MKKIRPFDITFIEPNQDKLSHLPLGALTPSSFVTNLRLLISYIKPGIDKCILLDADLVLLSDIDTLWQVDVTDYYMAAIIDPVAKVKQRFWIKDLPLPDEYHYVNTGMCVVNLKKWCEDNVEKKFFINADLYADKLEFPDQDILNITLYPHIKYLEPRYNTMSPDKYFNTQQKTQAYKEPVLFHWVGPKKPWLRNVRAFKEQMFWFRAKFSPFYDELKAEKGL